MTIFCLALGNPVPTISLYIGGHFVRQEIGRHMVTTIQNVSREMEHILCYATNGFGVPTQAVRKIKISCKYRMKLIFFVKIRSDSTFVSTYRRTIYSAIGYYIGTSRR